MFLLEDLRRLYVDVHRHGGLGLGLLVSRGDLNSFLRSAIKNEYFLVLVS